MIWKVFISVFFVVLAIYYFVCALEVFGFIKFTAPYTTIRFPKLLIPFYYFFKD